MTERREIRLRKTLRGIVLVLTALAMAAVVVSLLPGHEVYENGVLVGRIAAGGRGFPQFAMWLVAPGLVVWLHPKVGVALMWSVLAWLGTLALVSLTFSLDAGEGLYVELWPSVAAKWLIGPVMIALLFAMPIGLAIYKAITAGRDRDQAVREHPPLPAARVVSRRRA